jgi:hypothetical protein
LFEQADDPFGEPRLVTLAAWALIEEGDRQTRLVGLVQRPTLDESRPARSASPTRPRALSGTATRV